MCKDLYSYWEENSNSFKATYENVNDYKGGYIWIVLVLIFTISLYDFESVFNQSKKKF